MLKCFQDAFNDKLITPEKKYLHAFLRWANTNSSRIYGRQVMLSIRFLVDKSQLAYKYVK